MKKILVFNIALLMCFICSAQNNKLNSNISLPSKAYPFIKNPTSNYTDTKSISESKYFPIKNSSSINSKILGYTCYDQQSNNSPGRQIVNHGDGTLSFCWMIDTACNTSFSSRGSAYNYWNGSNLLYAPGTIGRIESIKTGFSQIALLGNGSEIIFAHKGSSAPFSDFIMSSNGSKGLGTWTGITANATLTASVVPGYTNVNGMENSQGYMCRISTGGSDGNTIHLIARYFEPGTILGINGPMVYSRSLDAGLSWDRQSVMLPGYDSTRTTRGSSEAYSIDAMGDTVAILHGGLGEDLTLWKSIDNGNTWIRSFVDSFAFAPSIDLMGGPTDTTKTNDGGMSTVIAPNGTVHVAFSTERLLNDSVIGNGSYSIFPGDVGLVYWNDNTQLQVNIPVTIAQVDALSNGGNNNGFYDVGRFTTYASASQFPLVQARYGNKALLSIPSISIEGSNIFIIFSLPADGDSTTDGQSFRDIWVVASQDGGVSWGPIQNITCTKLKEEYFISLAKRVDNYLHIVYQSDSEPGTTLQNSDPITVNGINYIVADKAKVLAGTAYCSASGLGVEEHANLLFNVTNNYPNPVSGKTFFDITMKQDANISLEIFNTVGQREYTSECKLIAGRHTLVVDAGKFIPGLYFYKINCGDTFITQKMIVAR